MAAPRGGRDRVSTKTKLARELAVLGRVLSRTREANGKKQGDVAAALGLPASYLSKIETGTRRLDVIEFLRIIEAIGADPGAVVSEVERELARLKNERPGDEPGLP